MKTVYDGDVVLNSGNVKEWEMKLRGIKRITGSVAVSGSATFPLLAEVGGSVAVYGSATFPLLAEVGGSVAVYGSAKADFPLLAEVGGSVAVSGSAKCKLLDRKITKNPKPIADKFAEKGYLFADGILTRLIRKNNRGDVVIYKTAKIGKSKSISYVVKRGELFSHGDTVKQAIKDLRYKISDRDTSKYKGWKLNSVHPVEEVIAAYRAITGACESGTKQFCENGRLPERMTIKRAIELTRGQYCADKFEAFFAGEKNEAQ